MKLNFYFEYDLDGQKFVWKVRFFLVKFNRQEQFWKITYKFVIYI